LILEDDGAILAENVVALVRGEGVTDIITRGGTPVKSVFTPLTIDRRSGKFWTEAVNRWKEQRNACRKKRSR
jgi:hypothetical protein